MRRDVLWLFFLLVIVAIGARVLVRPHAPPPASDDFVEDAMHRRLPAHQFSVQGTLFTLRGVDYNYVKNVPSDVVFGLQLDAFGMQTPPAEVEGTTIAQSINAEGRVFPPNLVSGLPSNYAMWVKQGHHANVLLQYRVAGDWPIRIRLADGFTTDLAGPASQPPQGSTRNR